MRWTWEQWQWRDAPYSPKPQHYWDLSIRLFCVISRTLVSGGAYPSAEVQCPEMLGNRKLRLTLISICLQIFKCPGACRFTEKVIAISTEYDERAHTYICKIFQSGNIFLSFKFAFILFKLSCRSTKSCNQYIYAFFIYFHSEDSLTKLSMRFKSMTDKRECPSTTFEICFSYTSKKGFSL